MTTLQDALRMAKSDPAVNEIRLAYHWKRGQTTESWHAEVSGVELDEDWWGEAYGSEGGDTLELARLTEREP